jgi:acetyltransferase-like isoleucine patch superfamily enzyme
VHVTAQEVADVIWGAELVGDPAATALKARALRAADHVSLSWHKPGVLWPDTADPAILIAATPHGGKTMGPGFAVIRCDNPRLGLAYALEAFFAARFRVPVIDRAASAAVHPSAVIGEPGLACEWDDRKNRWVRIPHIAGVVIGPDSYVGPHACVMRGLLSPTVVKKGAQVGNHATIGHGARVGPDAIVCPHVTLGGSSSVGRKVFVGIGAVIRPGVTVGPRAVIGQCANVTRDVPAGETWYGNPARRQMR